MKEIDDLINFLAKSDKEQVKVTELPKNCQTAPVVGAALGQGLIEIGRPEHSRTRKIAKCVYGKKIGDVDITYEEELLMDSGYSWTNLKGLKSAKFQAVWNEDVNMDAETKKKIGLCVRLTTEGLAKVTEPGRQLVGV